MYNVIPVGATYPSDIIQHGPKARMFPSIAGFLLGAAQPLGMLGRLNTPGTVSLTVHRAAIRNALMQAP